VREIPLGPSLKYHITAYVLESATEIKLGLDSKWGLSKRQHACEYAKACREVYRSTKVVRSPSHNESKSNSLLSSLDDIIRELVLSIVSFWTCYRDLVVHRQVQIPSTVLLL
jgi:hypothetical protein